MRIIAICSKEIKEEEIWIDEANLEINMTFDGFIYFQNPIKPESNPTILKLKDASIHSIIITGDSLLTSLNVALNCKVI